MTELSSKEVAERIGVSMSTLKNWAVRLPVPSTLGPDGTRHFPPEALEMLEAVKHLRHQERSYETIRRTINPLPAEPAPAELNVAEAVAMIAQLDVALGRSEAGTAPLVAPAATVASEPVPALAAEATIAPPAAASLEAPVALLEVDAGPTADTLLEEFSSAPTSSQELMTSEATLAPAASLALEHVTPDLAVVMARVLDRLNEQHTLSESYAAARQRVGELEMALRIAHEDRVRLQAELVESRRAVEQREEAASRRRPWWVRFFDFG